MPRDITEIIIHCTATRGNWYADKPVEDVVAELTRWHTEKPPNGNGWADCGYHYVIHSDGMVGCARPVHKSGAHCRGRNRTSIGVSLVGGRGGCKDDEFLDNFTEEQDEALRHLIGDLKQDYPSIIKISGHHEYANKACPCFSVEDWLIG